MKSFILFCISFVLISGAQLSAQTEMTYRLPPQEIIDLVDAPTTPTMNISPRNNVILLLERPGLPGIEVLAEEELRLGGIRFDPRTNGPSSSWFVTGMSLMNIDGSNPRQVTGLPENPQITTTSWSPDGNKVAFLHTADNGIELWWLDIATAHAQKITEPIINAVLGNSFNWLSDSETIVFTAVYADRGPAPRRPQVASGPVIQESMGRRAAVRTFQDLLSDKYDEAIFDYYTVAELHKTDLRGNSEKIYGPTVIWSFQASPDGNFLRVTTLQKPYSYIVPFSRFAHRYEVIDVQGNPVRTIADIPVTEEMPRGFGATREGVRSISWRNDAPATLYWVEALDGGDPNTKSEFRDQVFFLEAPFEGEPLAGFKTNYRYSGITWGNRDFALVSEFWQPTRMAKMSSFHPADPAAGLTLIRERSAEDRYGDPGNLQTTLNEYGRSVLMFDRNGRDLFLVGTGASPEGNRPFVDLYHFHTGETTRLWRSEAPYFESPVRIIDPDRRLVITRRESVEKHPNFYLRDLRNDTMTQITDFPEPFPQLRELQKEMIHFERADGIPLSGELFLPPGFDPGVDEPLPTIFWAYPREFLTTDGAGQVTGSPYTYTRLGSNSIVMLATQGYAVLNNAAFPIVAGETGEPNDTFVEQLVANAEAAIQTLVEMGVTDSERVGVSGHSYGAFMTANLVTHSDIFAAGVARSGAYNRTLTPFGFQFEERTYWQAPEVYNAMSPFMHADKMNVPLLLIHGADDNNAGTFPMQSERYYDALRGHGATVRLVMLPHESHGYRARESVLHMHWEWLEWFDRYVKNR
ncbi:MAG: S9 family peptidase [Bacteroidia bacterium]|nr:MAG: S9 family peptidase [Bacteroidia bacterium]